MLEKKTTTMDHEKVIYTKKAKLAGRFLNLQPSNAKIHLWLGARQHRSGRSYDNGTTCYFVNEPGPVSESGEETYPSTFLDLTFFVLLWSLAVLVCRVILKI